MLKTRSSIIKNIRNFFDDKGYLELDTPLLSPDLIPESCLEVFQTERLFPPGSRKEKKPLWLIPSPEIWIKKIIAQHRVNVFQVCKCFRNGESEGYLHASEFTMLEYYTMNADYIDSLALTEELIRAFYHEPHELVPSVRTRTEFLKTSRRDASNQGSQTQRTEFQKTSRRGAEAQRTQREEKRNDFISFERITVAQAFKQYAGFDLFEAAARNGAMEKEVRRLGLDPPSDLSVPQLYDLIFIHAVEPRIKTDKPVFLIDYPAFVPCLAKKSPNGETVERWELYWNGIELANCFSEETDPEKVKQFFISEEAAKNQNAVVKHNVDHNYWKMFESFPKCSGVAMGVDRLIMALTGRERIDRVIPFIF